MSKIRHIQGKGDAW